MKIFAVLIGSMIFGFWCQLSGQPSGGYLAIHGANVNAIVLIDSSLVCSLPIDSLALQSGSHHIVVRARREWEKQLLDTVVEMQAGRISSISIPEKYFYTVLSEPSGAVVSVRENSAGTTPLRFTTDRPLSLPITLSLVQYEPVSVNPPFNSLTRVHLFPETQAQTDRVISHSIPAYSTWVYGSLATTVAFGTASAYSKFKADSYETRYFQSGDPSFHNKSNTCNTLAASSLIITEIGFGILSYLLLSQ